jgi:hypothetical protein
MDESMFKTIRGETLSLQQMVLGELDIHIQKNEAGSLPHTIHKNYLNWIKP